MTDIYHITHIDNLSSIVNDGGLWCDNERLRQQATQVNIAYQDLKARRRQKSVPVDPGGVLADYVPFYFTTRSPMLYTIVRGNVPGVAINQRDIVYLVSSVEQIGQANCEWCFTDGHAVEVFTSFYTRQSELENIDWEVIRSRHWANSTTDPQRQRKKQAELLVHHFVPLACIREIAVSDNLTSPRVNQMLNEFQPRPQLAIRVRAQWYYTQG